MGLRPVDNILGSRRIAQDYMQTDDEFFEKRYSWVQQ
jgi:hypothetical protein